MVGVGGGWVGHRKVVTPKKMTAVKGGPESFSQLFITFHSLEMYQISALLAIVLENVLWDNVRLLQSCHGTM